MKRLVTCIIIILMGVCVSSCKEKSTPKKQPILSTFLNPATGYAHLPRLQAYDNSLFMSWIEERDSIATLNYAEYENGQWSSTTAVTSGSDWFVNWADFPALAINKDILLTHILQKSAAGIYDYDVKLSIVNLLSDTMINNVLLHTDGIAAEHGFVSMKKYKEGYTVSWLDGRNTKNEEKYKNAMSLRNAFIDKNGLISNSVELDNRVCDCCNTATAVTDLGPIVLYRDRSIDSIETRDMSIVRLVDGKWTEPKAIYHDNWKINGCPVNGPVLDAIDNNVVAAWFTSADAEPKVNVAFSNDSADTFSQPIRVDSGRTVGRVAGRLLKDGSAVVSWVEPMGDIATIEYTRVYPDGTYDVPTTLAETSVSRSSGFPQLEVMDDMVYIAYTDVVIANNPMIKTLKFSLD